MNTWRWALAPLALVVFANPASADDDAKPRGPRDPERRQKMLDEFDADGDGKLSEEERQTLREEMRERRGQREGKRARGKKGGRDGEAGPRGRRRGPGPDGPPKPPHPEELFKLFDADDDGMLSMDEFMELSREMRQRHGPPHAEGRRGPPRDGDRPRGRRGDRPRPPVEEDI